MDSTKKALRYKNLGNDPVFQELLEDLRAEQTVVFQAIDSSQAERECAHQMVCTISRLEAHVRRAENTLTAEAKRQSK